MQQKVMIIILVVHIFGILYSCGEMSEVEHEQDDSYKLSNDFILGADLSYVNEMIDCGAIYYNEDEIAEDPYSIFGAYGTDLMRVRLWHNPDWTSYSNFEDVAKAIRKGKENGMKILLDFHYSDDWTDPGKQKVPAAWLPIVNKLEVLGDSIYNYTSRVLFTLDQRGLAPEYVQIGNEINAEILQDPSKEYRQINWERNAYLINKGILAARDFSEKSGLNTQVMLHIAQPENAIWWFEKARAYGIIDYDWIGISYYPLWSSYDLQSLPEAIQVLSNTSQKKVMVVETAYPFTLNNADGANNILGSSALIDGFPASENGQYRYLQALVKTLDNAGAKGMVYWEPAWISTDCSTQWGKGSHWDNATLFDHNGKVNEGMKIYLE